MRWRDNVSHTHFFVIATQNPAETFATFPFPEAQSDRFMMKILTETHKKENELVIINRFLKDNLSEHTITYFMPLCIAKAIVFVLLKLLCDEYKYR